MYICKIDNTHKTDLSNVMDKKKTKEDVLRSFMAALEHKKAWQKQFVETYTSPGMKVEFF